MAVAGSDPAAVQAPVLETGRLRLRPHRCEDFEPLAAMYASSRSRFVGGPLSRATVWRVFASDVGQWVLLGFGAWAIEHRATGACVGQIGLNFPVNYPEREIGWLLWEGFEGRGYAFEAATRARRFAYEELGWTTLVSYVDPANDRSISLARRMGAKIDPAAPTPNDEPCLVFRHPPPHEEGALQPPAGPAGPAG